MTHQRQFFQRPRLWGIFCGLALAVAQLFTPAGVGTAQAATTTCTPNGAMENCTVTFAYSGAPESWAVPTGVTNVSFQVYGAQGGNIPGFGAGGNGGATTATLAVTPGQVLQINIGGQGVSPSQTTPPNGGGFNGGGSTPYCGSANGRGGGGASDVRWDDPSVSGVFTLDERLLVAGGGGGAAFERNGGAGGGINGTDGADGIGGEGGGGGSQTAGGAGGQGSATGCYAINGDNGSFGGGGTGGSAGGGGGGGYYGGGGGGSPSNGGRPGAGGGGSGFGPAGATFETGVRAGNGLAILSYARDTAAPVANPTQSPAAAPSGWNNSNVTVSWNWTDSGSGIDPANCTTSSVSSGSGTINLSATCKDLAGNTGTATYQVKVDPTAPTANPSQSPAANGAGWNNSDVTVNWNWTFTGAIIDTANCTTSSTSSGEGTLTLSATCKDVALNQRTVTYGVKVDKTAPVVTVTGVSDGGSYAVGSVPTAACSTTDGVSGVATQATLTITGGNGDGTGSFTATCSGATDLAGNSAPGVSVNYSVTPPPDTTAPVITAQVNGTLGNNGWYVSDVTVSWSVVDDESTISGQSGCETQNVTSDTPGVTFTCSATSAGGTASESVTIQRDATAPVVTVDNVSDGATYTLGSVPISGCSTDDGVSGVATPAAFSRSGGNPDGTGSFTITCSGAVDNAGNSGSASVGYTVSAGGTLVGVCGGYEVRQIGSSYTATGWSGAIKVGTSGKNTLTGGSGPDLMLGLGGNDKLDGKGGDDVLCGGEGVDLLQGMAGNDYLDSGAGNDVLNGGSGDHDQLLAGEGNDTLLDPDGVSNAQGGAGNDLFTLALRNGWRDPNGQTQFVGRLAAGYGNDTVILVILDRNAFFVDVTGDERDDPASPLEGNKDQLGLLGNLSPTPVRLKFEKQLVISAEAEGIVSEEAGAEYLTEPVGDESSAEATLTNRIFLPLINR